MDLTPASRELFVSLVEDAPNWSGSPLVTVTPAERGNLTDLKKRCLIATWEDEDGCVFAMFRPAGLQLAVELGYDPELLWFVSDEAL